MCGSKADRIKGFQEWRTRPLRRRACVAALTYEVSATDVCDTDLCVCVCRYTRRPFSAPRIGKLDITVYAMLQITSHIAGCRHIGAFEHTCFCSQCDLPCRQLTSDQILVEYMDSVHGECVLQGFLLTPDPRYGQQMRSGVRTHVNAFTYPQSYEAHTMDNNTDIKYDCEECTDVGECCFISSIILCGWRCATPPPTAWCRYSAV